MAQVFVLPLSMSRGATDATAPVIEAHTRELLDALATQGAAHVRWVWPIELAVNLLAGPIAAGPHESGRFFAALFLFYFSHGPIAKCGLT